MEITRQSGNGESDDIDRMTLRTMWMEHNEDYSS